MSDLPECMLPDSKFNLPLARKVLEYAEEDHDDFVFDMGDWFTAAKYGEHGLKICNTSACLAGTAALLAPEAKVDGNGIWIDDEWFAHDDGGAKLLGISGFTVDLLFYTKSNEHALDLLRQMIEYAEAHEDSW